MTHVKHSHISWAGFFVFDFPVPHYLGFCTFVAIRLFWQLNCDPPRQSLTSGCFEGKKWDQRCHTNSLTNRLNTNLADTFTEEFQRKFGNSKRQLLKVKID